MIRCPVCDLPAEPVDTPIKRRPGDRCRNLVTIIPLGPGASALVEWDTNGRPCPGTLRQFRPATIEEAA